MRFLSGLDAIMDTVRIPENYPVPKARPILAIICGHPATTRFIRIDHRSGPGCFADNYEGRVCLICGGITEEHDISQEVQRNEALKAMGDQ